MRADRDRRGARRRRRAPRPWSSLVRTSCRSPRHPALHRDHPGDARRTRRRPTRSCPSSSARLQGRVLVAHNAPFDRRVLRQAFDRVGLDWPEPPVHLHRGAGAGAAAAPARAPARGAGRGARRRGRAAHRALADAETCARVLCALFPRLCAHAATVGEALALLGRAAAPRARQRRRAAARRRSEVRTARPRPLRRSSTSRELPRDPGVYMFRDAAGRTLYVGKSVSIRSRARAHFAPSAPRASGARTRRSSTTGRPGPSSGRWCSRTG